MDSSLGNGNYVFVPCIAWLRNWTQKEWRQRMNREDIIRMAKEAGFKDMAEADYWQPLFKRFFNLATAYERKECAKLIFEIGSSRLASAILERDQA
jgi:hypothetical protein